MMLGPSHHSYAADSYGNSNESNINIQPTCSVCSLAYHHPQRNRTGPRRRGGRTVVRLNTAALWRRLTILNRSQNWLAREVRVSPGYMSMLVNGGRSPSVRIRQRMLKALGVDDFHELFRLEDRHDPT